MKIIEATILNDVETLKCLIDRVADSGVLQDVGYMSKPMPLHNISLFNQIIWDKPEYWKDEEMARWNRERVVVVMDFWHNYDGVVTFPRVQYNDYCEDFYCSFPEDSDEDILCDSIEDLVKAGCKELDLRLYCAVCRFDFDTAKDLVREGAKTYVETPDEGLGDDDMIDVRWDNCALHRLDAEIGYVGIDCIPLYSKLFEEDQVPIVDLHSHTSLLLGLAAHIDMERTIAVDDDQVI